jgi:hypothetical protein
MFQKVLKVLKSLKLIKLNLFNMKDIRGRLIKLGERVCVQEDIPSVDGMLYKHTIVKVESFSSDKLQVQDRSGKLWWVNGNQVSASFL